MENYRFGDKLIVTDPRFNLEETDFFLSQPWTSSFGQLVIVRRNGLENKIYIDNDHIKGIKVVE